MSYELVREQKWHEEHRGEWEPHRKAVALSVRVAAVARTYRHDGMSDATVFN